MKEAIEEKEAVDTKIEMTEEENGDYERKLRQVNADALRMTDSNGKRYIEMFQKQWPIEIKLCRWQREMEKLEAGDPLISRLRDIFSTISYSEEYSRKPTKRPPLIKNIWPACQIGDEIVELEKRGSVKILSHGTRVRTAVDFADDVMPDLPEREMDRWRSLKKAHTDLNKEWLVLYKIMHILVAMGSGGSFPTPLARMVFLKEAKERLETKGVDLSKYLDVDELDARISQLDEEARREDEEKASRISIEKAKWLKIHPRQPTLLGETAADV